MSNPDAIALRAFLAHPKPQLMTSGPLLLALGARLETWDADRTELTMRFSPDEMFRQGAGLIQGGAVATMLDFTLAFVAMATLSEQYAAVTTSLNTNLVGASKTPDVTVKGRVRRAGRKVIFADGDMISEGRLIATASATLLVVEAR